MRRVLCLLVVSAGLIFPGTAHAASLQDFATQAGISQSNQSFNTLVFDYNQDGIQDFLYSPQNDSAGRQLWRGNADGTFTLVAHLKSAVTSDQHGCTSADFDGNGLPDIYCTLGALHGSRTKANPVWLQTSPGVWKMSLTSGAEDPYGRSYSATTLDANGDGIPDLFVSNLYPRPDGIPTPDELYLGNGDGTFRDAGAASGVEVEQGDRGCDFSTDFNGDGHPDIVFCGHTGIHFYQNNGDGTFTDVSVPKVGSSTFFASDAKLADVNGDGLLDLVYIRNGQEGVRLGTPSGKFASATLTHDMKFGRSLEVADVNGDGYLDIYALEGNGVPGCLTCTTNYPDYLYLGGTTTLGKYTSALAATTNTPGQGGSGDTVNAISINGHNDLIVGNGANLMKGPLQLWGWTP
jgi:hypothetical protein